MYSLTYEDGIETFETLDEALDRASDLAIAGTVIHSLRGPEGTFAHDLIDVWMYKKLDAADTNVDPATMPREDCHAIPPPVQEQPATGP
jgi:hypothetical protein